jgi:hypothetical protein
MNAIMVERGSTQELVKRAKAEDRACLLGYLFLGVPQSLPCGSGLSGDNANLQLLDHDGDKKIDLSDPIALLGFLFLGGPPPQLGLECTQISGCTSSCSR